jgi:hypothetical protein
MEENPIRVHSPFVAEKLFDELFAIKRPDFPVPSGDSDSFPQNFVKRPFA